MIASFVLALWAATASAASSVTLAWNHVDFAACASDPEKSGYILYKSMDDGVTKTEIGRVSTVENTFAYQEAVNARYCYFAKAYNQVLASLIFPPQHVRMCRTLRPLCLLICG